MNGTIAVFVGVAVLLVVIFLAVWGIDRVRSRRQAQDPERSEAQPEPQVDPRANPRADSWSDPHGPDGRP